MYAGLDPARNWSMALNRLGFGAIAIFLIVETDPLPAKISDLSPSLSTAMGTSDLITAFAFIVAASIIGTICASLGQLVNFGPGLNSKRMFERVVRMGALQENSFVTAQFRDAKLQYELYNGVLGTAFFVVIASIFVGTYATLWGVETPSDAGRIPTAVLFFITACVALLVVLLHWSIGRAFQQLDTFLFCDDNEGDT